MLCRPLAVALLLSWPATAQATALTPAPAPSPVLREALRELQDQPVAALPGADDDFDREHVLGLLPTDGRILLRPPAPLGAERDDDGIYQAASDWAREQDLEV